MLERRRRGVDASGPPVCELHRANRPRHWLFVCKVQVGDPRRQPLPRSVDPYVWQATPVDQPGGGMLRLKQFGPHMHDALESVEMARGRRLAEALHALGPSAPRAPPPPHSERNDALELVDARKVCD